MNEYLHRNHKGNLKFPQLSSKVHILRILDLREHVLHLSSARQERLGFGMEDTLEG